MSGLSSTTRTLATSEQPAEREEQPRPRRGLDDERVGTGLGDDVGELLGSRPRPERLEDRRLHDAVEHLLLATVVDGLELHLARGAGDQRVEVADARPDELEVGSPVVLTFRRLFTAGGVHNYFWKARPVRPGQHPQGGTDEQ